MSERSFFINGNQMPVCARCLGLFIGVSFGIILPFIIRINVDEKIHKRILTALLAVIPLS
ncbi:MAG: DUF2085 domain-containing protein [Candidatus Bathyarchaeia archaeon]